MADDFVTGYKDKGKQAVKDYAKGSWLKRAVATLGVLLVVLAAMLMHQTTLVNEGIELAKEINTTPAAVEVSATTAP